MVKAAATDGLPGLSNLAAGNKWRKEGAWFWAEIGAVSCQFSKLRQLDQILLFAPTGALYVMMYYHKASSKHMF